MLIIEIPTGTTMEFRQALVASLMDLHLGVLAVGGLTAVGRGIFEGEALSINNDPISINDKMFEQILQRLEG